MKRIVFRERERGGREEHDQRHSRNERQAETVERRLEENQNESQG